MKKFLLIAAVLASAAVPALAAESSNNQQVSKCVERIGARCGFTMRDIRNLNNVVECKQVASGLDVALLENGRVAAVSPSCRASQYNLGGRVATSKSIAGKLYMLTTDGRVFFMASNQQVYEVLNSRGSSYSSVSDIKGDSHGGTSINLVFNNGQVVNIDSAELEMKALRGQLRAVQFWSMPTVWSVFG